MPGDDASKMHGHSHDEGRGVGAVDADVLVVEDEVLVLMLLCDAFEDAGLCVEAAPDAEAALSLLEGSGGGTDKGKVRSRALRPGVLVTDLNLGPGADGLSLAAEARRLMPGLPVVYVTGNPDLVSSRGLGPGEVLVPKPFDPIALAEEVRALARAARQRRQAPPTDGPASGPGGTGPR
jgi:DNA-binding response OmpR family regulator